MKKSIDLAPKHKKKVLNFLVKNYTLLGLRDESLDNSPNTATVIKKKTLVYTNNFKVNIR